MPGFPSACTPTTRQDAKCLIWSHTTNTIEGETDRSPLDAGRCREAPGEYDKATGRYDLMYVGCETALVRCGEQHNWERLRAISNPMLRGWENLACDLVSRPAIGKWLAQGWVFLPETRTACRNLGLVLEMLRRKGEFRDLILVPTLRRGNEQHHTSSCLIFLWLQLP